MNAQPPSPAVDGAEPWVQAGLPGAAERLRSGTARVSVITPSYNQAAFLEQAMRSVLDQAYPHLEYIVVDGGSTDGSVDIIRRYADRLAFWASEPDRGQANALNKGIARASGDIVGWINSDDFYYPGAIRAAVEAFADDPALGFVYGRGNRVDEEGALIERFKHTRPFDLDALTNGIDYILQPTVFMRRDALAVVGPLDPALQWTLDWDLWIRLGRQFPARMIDHLIAASREYGATKTSSGGLDRVEEIRRFVRRHTGQDVSLGYLNYLMCELAEAVTNSNLPDRMRLKEHIHHVLVVCDQQLRIPQSRKRKPIGAFRRYLRGKVPASASARRLVRNVVPLPLRRRVGMLLEWMGLLPPYKS